MNVNGKVFQHRINDWERNHPADNGKAFQNRGSDWERNHPADNGTEREEIIQSYSEEPTANLSPVAPKPVSALSLIEQVTEVEEHAQV